ncbi:MAG: iron/ascorbate oxidoreductase [Cyclobacteriaceae bacterium]|nr:MAG: iron/ascorbate oxidoreductase [Cyclobacteriaceae bacterium]
MQIPLVDIEPLSSPSGDTSQVAKEIHRACREHGFFYVVGHGVSKKLQDSLESLSWKFFNQPEQVKSQIAMELGGKAWRGYFPVLSELTSGKPDIKEGLYFGEELSAHDPRVKSGLPLHGANLFPDIPDFKQSVIDYLNSMSQLGRLLMRGIAISLDLPDKHFEQTIMSDPLILFRIFHYPAKSSVTDPDAHWGVGEHTDYGVLTILKQDAVGGLQVFNKNRWIDAPYLENSFVCNIGDMLDRMTGGYYRSTPHRVQSNTNKGRLSFPFFYDLNFTAVPADLNLKHLGQERALSYTRWDQSDIQSYTGTYGQYLIQKVGKVFPMLKDNLG